MIRKVVLFVILMAAVAGVMYTAFFAKDIKELYPGFSWFKLISLTILVVGCYYAVMERSVMIGIMTLVGAAALPWVKFWITVYWPWFKYYYMNLTR